MGKVITVWGSPGSGKSMFCCILAKALTRDKRKAIIINADMNVPMLPVWLPEQIIQTNTSIGQVLSSVEIDTSLVASHVTVLKNYPFIGMMGYAAGENPLSYPEVKYLAGLTACFPTVRRSTDVLPKAVCSRLSPTVTPNTLLH